MTCIGRVPVSRMLFHVYTSSKHNQSTDAQQWPRCEMLTYNSEQINFKKIGYLPIRLFLVALFSPRKFIRSASVFVAVRGFSISLWERHTLWKMRTRMKLDCPDAETLEVFLSWPTAEMTQAPLPGMIFINQSIFFSIIVHTNVYILLLMHDISYEIILIPILTTDDIKMNLVMKGFILCQDLEKTVEFHLQSYCSIVHTFSVSFQYSVFCYQNILRLTIWTCPQSLYKFVPLLFGHLNMLILQSLASVYTFFLYTYSVEVFCCIQQHHTGYREAGPWFPAPYTAWRLLPWTKKGSSGTSIWWQVLVLNMTSLALNSLKITHTHKS